VAGEASELRVVVMDCVGEGLDGLSECGEFVGDRDDRAVGSGLPVVLDDGAGLSVPADRGPGDSGAGQLDATPYKLAWLTIAWRRSLESACSVLPLGSRIRFDTIV